MLRKIILSLTLTTLPFLMNAKMAKWLVKPEYESIELRDNGLAQVWKGGKYGLMKPNGEIIVDLKYDDISEFHENLALLYIDNKFVGFTDRTGKILPLADRQYFIPFPEVGFQEGYLVVQNSSGNEQYINDEGEVLRVKPVLTNGFMSTFAKAYPFFEGYALVEAYENPAKPDKTYPAYISRVSDKMVKFPNVNPTDVNFLSSFHNHEAIAVIKKKFYFVKTNADGNINDLQLITVDVAGLKKPVVIELSDKEADLKPTKYGYLLEAKNGEFKFDPFLRLIAYRLINNDWVEIEYTQPEEKTFDSNFSKFTDDSMWGLKYFDTEILPPQFDQVRYMRGDNAVVGSNGKYGIITIDKDAEFEFKINNNEEIGFKHQYYECPATIQMPTFIDLDKSSFSSVSPDFIIKKETRNSNKSFEGNYITYDCRIAIPSNLTNELTKQPYQFSVFYDGLTSPVYTVPVTEWYVRLYEVEMPQTEYQIGKDESIQVEFEIKSRDGANVGNYFKTVDALTMDPLYPVSIKQISEDHYIINIAYADTDRLPFRITVTENGCPTINFPFEAIFTNTSNKKNAKKKVTINPIH